MSLQARRSLTQVARRRTPHPSSRRQAPPVFSDHCFQHFLVQAQVGDQMLQPPVFILQPFQPLCFVDVHAAVLRLPGVDCRVANTNLPSQFGYFAPGFVLLQHADDLLFCEPPLLHLWISFSSSLSLRRFSRSSILTGRDYRGHVMSRTTRNTPPVENN